MKKVLMLSVMVLLIIGTNALIFSLSGCGGYQRWKEGISYKTLTGQTGNLKLYSGGVLIAEYPEAKIIYSSTDTDSFIFKARVDGDTKKLYWQGDAFFELE